MPHPLSETFRTYAESMFKDSSPLYHALSNSIAQDDSILEVAAHASPGQPAPHMLFASVQYLLSSDLSHPLGVFYGRKTTSSPSPSDAYPAFQDFVHRHRQEIVSLISSRRVQTNEVGRCACLFPAVLFAASHFEPRPLALVEIGTSAGINLFWDRYRYSYGDSTIYGNSLSAVQITSSFRGITPSILSEPLPNISHRIGVDINIVDTSVPNEAAWLQALIWHGHHERRSHIDVAVKMHNEQRLELDLRTGDGFAMLADLAREIPTDSLLCVYHTWVAYQISKEAQERFMKEVETIGAKRDLIHIFNNINPSLHLTAYRQGQVLDMPLANVEWYGQWIEWLQKNKSS